MKMDDRIGSLEPGKRADLVAVDLSGARTQPLWDVFSTLVYAVKERDVSLTMVEGRVLWDGARIATVDEAKVVRDAEEWRKRIAASLAASAAARMSLFVRTIVKKRDGGELSEGEIDAFVTGVTDGTITDEQAAAFLMAVCCRGMTTAESAALTFAMMRSGETWDLSRHGFVADKHSTGGVGDKATLVLAPLLAAVGVKAGMMSGRGLGHTGGTLDKLEAIPGFVTALPKQDFDRLLDTVGCALIGQTDSIAPADRRLYALRDVTGTVESIPLITASILSKKLATGASAVVFDVKTGNGAFMADPKDAERLGKALVETTRATGRKSSGYLTAMDRPLGEAVGNANEVEESIRMLGGEGPADLRENTLLLGADLVLAAGLETSAKEARRRLNAALSDGRALEVFREAHRGAGRRRDGLRRSEAAPAARFPARRPGARIRRRHPNRDAGNRPPRDRARLRTREERRRRRPGFGLPREEEAGRRRGEGRAPSRRGAGADGETEPHVLRPPRELLHDRARGHEGRVAAVRRRNAVSGSSPRIHAAGPRAAGRLTV